MRGVVVGPLQNDLALFELGQHIVRNRFADRGAVLDGKAVDRAELNLAGIDVVLEQELQDTARFIRNHRSDSVPAAYADCDFGEGFKINKITLLFHVLDALRLPFQKRFKLSSAALSC